jgi:hypothetical protein
MVLSAGHRARHGRRCRGRLDDRLCHHGDEPGADDRPGDRRLSGRGLRLAGKLRLLLVGLASLAAGLGRPGRNLGPPRAPQIFARAGAAISPASDLAAVLGLCAVGGFASGAFLRLSGRRTLVGTEVFHLSPAQIGCSFALTAIGYAAGNFLAGATFGAGGDEPDGALGGLHHGRGDGRAAGADAVPGCRGRRCSLRLTMFMGVGNGVSLPNANAGILSVRPELAGTASGLGGRDHDRRRRGAGGADGGRCWSAVESEVPLILVMLVSSLLGPRCRSSGSSGGRGRWGCAPDAPLDERPLQSQMVTLQKGGPHAHAKALCRGQAARDSHAAVADAKGLCRQAGRVAALSEPDGEQPPPGVAPAWCWRWRRNSGWTSPN